MKRIIKYIAGSLKIRQEAQKKKAKVTKVKRPPTIFPAKCKNRKDHVIGLFWDYEESTTITLKSADADDKIISDNFEPFRHCPHCGKSLTRMIRKIRGEL